MLLQRVWKGEQTAFHISLLEEQSLTTVEVVLCLPLQARDTLGLSLVLAHSGTPRQGPRDLLELECFVIRISTLIPEDPLVLV